MPRVYDEMEPTPESEPPGAVLWRPAPAGMITAHFSWAEAVCHHCGLIPGVDVIEATAEWMETVRVALGSRPIHVSSWARCVVHNKAVGGAPHSYHTRGMAIDFTAQGLTVPATWRLCKALQVSGLVGGLGRYTSWIHADTGPKRNWNGP